MIQTISADEAITLAHHHGPYPEFNADVLNLYRERLAATDWEGDWHANLFATSEFFVAEMAGAPYVMQNWPVEACGEMHPMLHPMMDNTVCCSPLLYSMQEYKAGLEQISRDLSKINYRWLTSEPQVLMNTYTEDWSTDGLDPAITWSECPMVLINFNKSGDVWEKYLASISDGKRRKKLRAYVRNLEIEGYHLDIVQPKTFEYTAALNWMIGKAAERHGYETFPHVLHQYPGAVAEVFPKDVMTAVLRDRFSKTISVAMIVVRWINGERVGYLHSFVADPSVPDIGRASLGMLVKHWLENDIGFMDVFDATYACTFDQTGQNGYKRVIANAIGMAGASGAAVNRFVRPDGYFSAKHGWVAPTDPLVIRE